MSFYVVLAEDWCAAVPYSWVDKEDSIYWWPKEKLHTAMIRQLEPDMSWNSAPYQRVLGPYDTLKEARGVEIRMAEISTEDEEHLKWATEGSKGKRRVKKRTFEDFVVEQGCQGGEVDEMPPPPSGFKPHDSEVEVTNGEESPSNEVRKVATQRKSLAETSQEIVVEVQLEDPQALLQQASTSTVLRDVTIETNNASTLEESVSINDDLSVVQVMKSEFRRLSSRIDALENTVLVFLNEAQVGRGGREVCESTSINLPSFPLDSFADLRKFEAELQKSEDVRKQLKVKVKFLGGISGEQHFRRALTHLLSNDLAYQLTWMAPQHGSRKRGPCIDSVYFSALTMCDVVIAAVMECHATSSSVASLERVGKQWLQHAGDRLKYAEKKRK
ncbi:uncharacterized protein LOC124172244 isoform X2 [Ischnura elegans]|nr:uncharacterized protein LOC124172244 isoform X2 [Ischnura elegans]